MESNRKRRVLFTGEASFLATGFSTYLNEVISRLHATGEFLCAEMGSYAHDDDPRCQQVPWKFYPVAPARSNQAAMQQYMSSPTNQFGEAKFDDVCLDFKPDIVCSIRDWWMDEFIERSPLRNNFKFIWMPTIDGEPERELWLDTYKRCDRVLTYSEYGMDLLKRTGRRGTNLVTIASPGVDLEMFKPPENKRDHKARLGIDPNSLIVGTVMRNQKRKLYYDLIEAFSMWLHQSKTKGHLELAKRTFLYLHTSYPDVGYDIGKAIRDFKIGNKVIMTYLCSNCQTAYPSFFNGEMMVCRKCGKLAAHPPNANHSCPRNVLADIMKTFDLYVQYSICLHPDTPIMTSDGWEAIGDIQVGNMVVGKDGKLHRVYKTMRNPSDKCFDVKIKGRPWSITATDNHPWLVVDRTGLSKGIESIVNREHYHQNKNMVSAEMQNFHNRISDRIEQQIVVPIANEFGFENIPSVQVGTEFTCPELTFIYKRTDELQPGDLLVNRIPTEEIIPNYDLPFLDEDMAYYLGLFAADGKANISNGNNRITLHGSDNINLEKIQKIANKMGKRRCIRDCTKHGRNAKDVDINSVDFTKQLRPLLYHKDNTKQLPYGCHLWPTGLQEALIRGLIAGDGSQKNKKRPWTNTYSTTSLHIAKLLGPILEKIGWYYNCSITYRDNRLPMYRFEIRIDGQRKSHETLYKDGFVFVKIESCEKSDFSGEVVNIDVEDDHHYVTLEGLQHNCEGAGMPAWEAMACGVPVAAPKYSAMEDYFQCPTSIPIDVERFFWEAIIETEQKRALPSNIDFANKLDKFLKQNETVRGEKSKRTRAYAEELVPTYGQDQPMRRRGWERTAAIWGQVIRETPIKDQKTTWLCPTPRIHRPNLVPPNNNMNNSEFVNWVIGKVWNRPDMLQTHFAGEWLKSLNSGSKTVGDRRVPFDRKAFVEHFMEMVHQANIMEEKRLASLKREVLDQVNVTVI
jgi:glycosyltransferase involved in cell wall biosynthesis